MTTSKGQFRKRRGTTLTGIPKNIQQWFSGERRFTFFAFTYPYTEHISEYWNAWVSEHPEAVKPEMLDLLTRPGRMPNKKRL